MKHSILYLSLFFSLFMKSQGNCLIYPEGSGAREACELCYEAIKHPQGSKESQQIFDKAIAVGPNYAWAYYEKSVPYFKRGFLYEGLQILNKAVELEPLRYLCYRGYWCWQYKNYDLCIKDLEQFYAMPKSYNEFTPGGEKNMKLILALAYTKKENIKKAIQIVETYMEGLTSKEEIGLSDYHTLGVLYFKNKEYDKAITVFQKQLSINKALPDTYYFLGLAHKKRGDLKDASIQFNQALLVMNDPYHYQNVNSGFPVYMSDVKKEIENVKDTK